MNNLSWPTKFMPSVDAVKFPSVTCNTTYIQPTGSTVFFPEQEVTDKDGNVTIIPEGDYYLQKTDATWTADCIEDDSSDSVEVIAKWGDNLVGDGQLRAKKPIRVEVNLTENNGTSDHNGYKVWKLDPNELDRNSRYGTRGGDTLNASVSDLDNFFPPSNPATQPYRVYDQGATLKIERCTSSACSTVDPTPIYNAFMPAEINSTGAVVYGYNWGTSTKGVSTAPEAGTYKLTFASVLTNITSNADSVAILCSEPVNKCTQVIVTLTQGGGRRP